MLAKDHVRIVEESLEQLLEPVFAGEDVVVLLDSITRLARAYNTLQGSSGRTLSGGLDANTKEKVEARKAAEKRDANYMATSPGAPYDASRNKRLLQKQQDAHYDQVAVDDGGEYHMNATTSAADPHSSRE